MAFNPLRRIYESDVKVYTIGNSEAITVGDAVIPGATTHAGAVIGAKNTTGIVIGVVKAIFTPGSKPLEKNSVTVASDNETVGLIAAEIIWTHLDMEWEADLSQASGTTANSNLIGQFNLSASSNAQLDETSYGVFSTQKQFASFGVSPVSTSKVRGKWSSTKTL